MNYSRLQEIYSMMFSFIFFYLESTFPLPNSQFKIVLIHLHTAVVQPLNLSFDCNKMLSVCQGMYGEINSYVVLLQFNLQQDEKVLLEAYYSKKKQRSLLIQM